MLKLATKPLVAVIWDDAHGSHLGDYSESEIERDFHKPVRYTSFGLLVTESAAGYTLAGDTSEGQYRGITFVPKGMVVEIVNLGVPTKKAPRKQNKGTGVKEKDEPSV